MVQVSKQLGLMLERLSETFVRKQSLLQSNCAAQSLVGRHIDRPHAALTDSANYLVSILKYSIRSEHFLSKLLPVKLTLGNANIRRAAHGAGIIAPAIRKSEFYSKRPMPFELF